jgi:hypothetical protein
MATVATADRSKAPVPSRTQAASPISWMPNHELDAHEWAATGRRIGAVGRCIQWLLGDWIAYGNAKFGERYARASKITGYDPQTLMNMVYVASRFPISRRRENLSWSHHETLASLDSEEQDRWLDEASKHRWSVLDLRMMLRAARKERLEEDDELSPGEADGRAGSAARSDRNGSVSAGKPPEQSVGAVVVCPRCGERVTLGKP